MFDPTWLPSTIMQAIGALYGIFIAIFILVIQSLFDYKKDIEVNSLNNHKKVEEEKSKFNDGVNTKINLFKKLFIVLTYFVFITELFNGILVYLISDSIFEKFNYWLFASYVFFICLLIYFVWFSYFMISFLISLKIGNPDFNDINIFDRICKVEFFTGITTIASIFISAASYFIMRIKLNYEEIPSFVFAFFAFIILLLVIKGGSIIDSLRGRKVKSPDKQLKL